MKAVIANNNAATVIRRRARRIQDASYYVFHSWLRRNYGKADRCENKTCAGKGKRHEWALIKGKQHGRDRNSYMKLCSVCHLHYDWDNSRAVVFSERSFSKTKTHCPNGHAYDESNTQLTLQANGRPKRQCRACKRDWLREYYKNPEAKRKINEYRRKRYAVLALINKPTKE